MMFHNLWANKKIEAEGILIFLVLFLGRSLESLTSHYLLAILVVTSE